MTLAERKSVDPVVFEISDASHPESGFVYGTCGAPGCNKKIAIEVRSPDVGLSKTLGLSVSSATCGNNHINYCTR